MTTVQLPSFRDVLLASERLHGRVRCTPVMRSDAFDRRSGLEVHFKCENLQEGGSFKLRGAYNALLAAAAGSTRIATHSSGNHGAALALAARALGRPCTVVVPRDASGIKIRAIEQAGARIVYCEPGMDARAAALARLIAVEPAQVVHPFDDSAVIAGQGTAALELLSTCTALDAIVCPVGGGGLLGGTALATRALSPQTSVVAGEPAAADDAYRSLTTGTRLGAGNPVTVADGLRGSIGVRNFELMRRGVKEIITVSEAEIIAAMRITLQDLKLLIEPSSAVAVAVVLSGRARTLGRRVGLLISGGNVDLDACPYLSGRHFA